MIELVESLEGNKEGWKSFIYEHILHLKDQAKYRSMIKGFHLAFNVKEKLVFNHLNEAGSSKHMTAAERKSAKELKDNALKMKMDRLRN